MSSLLSLWGHAVSAAEDVASAKQFIDHNTFDVILSDIDLPDGDGYDVVAEVKKRKLPVMIAAVTSMSTASDVQKAREAGFDYHFPKPVQLDRLRAVLSVFATPSAA